MIEVKEHSGYSVGDRVRFIHTGEMCEVAMVMTSMVGVRFDDFARHRHDLDGAARQGHGWWVFPHEIERVGL